MSYLFSVEDDLQTCIEQLVEFGIQSSKFQVAFARQSNQNESIEFTIRRKAPTLTAAHPFLHGKLDSSGGTTQVSGQMHKTRSGTFLVKSWAYSASIMGALGSAWVIVEAARVRLGNYVQEPPSQFLFLLAFIFVGIFVASYVEKMQPLDPSEFLEWLYNCFAEKPNEELIETASEIKNEANFNGLTRRVLMLSAAGLIVGTLFGLTNDVEANLDPLRITVTDLHTCIPSEDGSSFVRKGVFKPTDTVYGCGDLDIEIIDHRQIKIEFWLRRDYQNGNECPAGYIDHEVNAAGEFALPLRAPKDGRYRTGQYTMQIGRSKNRYGELTFDIVDR